MPPRKTTPVRTSDKPRITGLNMDKLVREDAPTEPYTIALAGRVYTFKDPMEKTWQEQVKIDTNNVVAILRGLMDAEDWKHFREVPLEAWKLVRLAHDVHAYYRATPEDLGNGSASPGY